MPILLLSLIFINFTYHTFSQNTYTKLYGGSRFEAGYALMPVTDNGFIIAGATTSFGNGKKDLYLLRTDSAGNEIWSAYFGDTGNDIGYSLESCSRFPSGGFVVLGTSERFSPDNKEDFFLIRFDNKNNYLWSRYYGGTLDDVGKKVKQTPDGGFILFGETNSFENASLYFYLVKTDSLGLEKWSGVYGTYYNDFAVSLDLCTNGGYILFGYSLLGNGTTDLLLVKCDDQGNELWKKFIGGTKNESAGKILEAKDHGFYLLGTTNSYGTSTNDILLMKTDSAGNFQWKKLIDTKGADKGIDMIQLEDSSLTLLCSSDSIGNNDMEDFYLIHTDPLGNILWTNRWGSFNEDYPHALANSGDSGVALVGETYGFGQNQGALLFIKHDRGGDTVAFPVKIFRNTSLKEIHEPEAGFKFFPNPAGEDLIFILNNPQEEKIQIEILDFSCRRVFSDKFFVNKILNVGFLKSGIYEIKVNIGERVYWVKWVKL